MSEAPQRVFAYGSNLSPTRIAARVGRVITVSVGSLGGHDLRFHKHGRDGSGKADAFWTGRERDVVWGVVYEVSDEAKAALDHFEGLGTEYLEKTVEIATAAGRIVASVYHAHPQRIDPALSPFDWYLDLVLYGARAHGLPHAYVERIASVPRIVDTRDG